MGREVAYCEVTQEVPALHAEIPVFPQKCLSTTLLPGRDGFFFPILVVWDLYWRAKPGAGSTALQCTSRHIVKYITVSI